MTDRIKCNRCKMNLTIDKFKKKRDDTYQKRCIECNTKCTIYTRSRKSSCADKNSNIEQQ